MQNELLIQTRNLIKRYPMGGNSFTALRNVNLEFYRGEFTGIVGPSGSGKTTLLNIIGSLDAPSEGSAIILGRAVESLSHKAAADLRNRYLGFIFQTYNLLPVYTVYENVEFPLLLLGMSAREREQAVHQTLEWVHLEDKVRSKPAQLSGGEAQRVAIARAIVKRPQVVIADEPTANLDAANSHHILQTMVEINEKLNTTFIFSTHDDKVIKYLRRIIHLDDGKVVGEEIVGRDV